MAERTEVTRHEGEAIVPEHLQPGSVFSPQVDIMETPESVVVIADLPGISKDNLEVVLEKGVLTIEGRYGEEKPPAQTLNQREYEVGSFHRCFAVGEGLDPEGVAAALKDGVLRLTIPKADRCKPRRIEIKGG